MRSKLLTIAALLATALTASALTAVGTESGRANVGAGVNVLVLGIGYDSTNDIVIRGLGPSIAQFLPPGTQVLNNPTVTIYNSQGAVVLTQNSYTQETTGHQTFIAAAGLTPSSTNEVAILFLHGSHPSDLYTAVLSGQNGSVGIGLVDVYVVY